MDTSGFAHPGRNIAALRIEPGMKIADFGSGSGAYALAIAEVLGGSGHVYAIDVQKDLLRRTWNEAKRRSLAVLSVIWGDVEQHEGSKLAGQSVDIVLISNLLFQVVDKRAVFAEAHRILKPRGTCAVIDWSDSFGGMGPDPASVFRKEDALAAAHAAGFDGQSEFHAGAHHYGLLFTSV